ncbi:hypothetical protein ACEYYB_06380 [Paracoccus sp. p4-l81]|uniref:hypothetical protein n=1 Tax=unclassified Paracoccus (in: a-proteobacteria) TaxID=2688777 RepID=UPI0035B969F7
MTRHFTEDEAIAAVARLTRPRLTAFVSQQVIRPIQTPQGPAFAQIDLTRMELACDLCDDFGLDEDALSLVLSLVDQLHGMRADLHRMLDAVRREPDEVRARIRSRISGA